MLRYNVGKNYLSVTMSKNFWNFCWNNDVFVNNDKDSKIDGAILSWDRVSFPVLCLVLLLILHHTVLKSEVYKLCAFCWLHWVCSTKCLIYTLVIISFCLVSRSTKDHVMAQSAYFASLLIQLPLLLSLNPTKQKKKKWKHNKILHYGWLNWYDVY